MDRILKTQELLQRLQAVVENGVGWQSDGSRIKQMQVHLIVSHVTAACYVLRSRPNPESTQTCHRKSGESGDSNLSSPQ
jgi:hypothetical protein